MKFHVPEMSCGHCIAAIEAGVKQTDPAAEVTTDLATRMVTVSTQHPVAEIAAAIGAAGYEATAV